MQTFQRTVAVLIFPAVAWLGAACGRTDTPTEVRRPAGAFLLSNNPTTRWVNYDGDILVGPGTSCENPGYKTVQAAVDDATQGDRINVCPGTYMEQVTIPAGKDGIRLLSVRRWAAVIKAPALMVPYNGNFIIVRIAGAQNVTILAFTITGPGPTGCGSLHYGVRVDNGGSADILGNHITQIRDEPFSGCQNGVAVLVGRRFEGTTGSARIIGNVIDDYQKNGPTVDNAGSHAEIVNNRVLGHGPTAVTAQNGMQVSRGATAEIRHNFVSGNIYTPQTFAAAGILLFASGAVLTDHNTASSNDVSIWMIAAAGGSMTTNNRVRASTFDGVDLDLTNNATVTDNFTELNGGPGIGLYDGATGNTLANNQIERNSNNVSSATDIGGGILLDDASNNILRSNHIRKNGTLNGFDNTDGIRLNFPSTGNSIQGNRLRDNVTHDCHDASTGNTWVDNRGETSSPPGLCGEDREDDYTAEAGWDPAYPWYAAFDVAPDYDWATAYATIDTNSLLQLLPQIRLGGIRRATVSPDQ